MADLLNSETLSFFLIFVVPGFVAIKVHDLIIPATERDFSKSLIEIVSYSMLNWATLFWAIRILHAGEFPKLHPVGYALGMIGILVIAPCSWVLLARAARTWRPLRRLFLHPSPTAWDYFFDKRQPGWALLHLKSGEMIGGLLKAQSCASSFPRPQDLYLQQVWHLDAEGRFLSPIDQSMGTLVKMDECTHMEFFALGDPNE